MRIFIGLSLLFAAHQLTLASEKCLDKNQTCNSTNYETYVQCIRHRSKRSVDCDYSCNGNNNCINICNSCDCNQCNYANCQSGCSSCCSSCCSNYLPCSTNHCCHKTCHAQCTDTQCRSSCRKNCFEIINKNIDTQNNPNNANVNTVNKHNVTTIIHLNNVINNTNIVDIPITLNNTNEQNITLHAPSNTVISNKEVGNSGQIDDKCCIVIGPRQCESYPKPRCYHYRSKQCGPYCTATIVHKEQQQVCETYPGATQNCRQQIIYIPQPQPRCVYQSVWPYVACGIQQQASCEGCYSHYVDQTSTNYANCPTQCYDQGYNLGPMYRQGPVYRPTYYHSPYYANAYPPIQDYFGSYNPYYQPYPAQTQQLFNPYYQIPQNETVIDVPVEAPDGNSTGSPVEFPPLFSAGSGLGGQQFYPDPFRNVRDIEIETNFEPKSTAQAEITIKNSDKDDGINATKTFFENNTEEVKE